MNNAHDFMVGLVASHFGVPAFSAGDRVEVLVAVNRGAIYRAGSVTRQAAADRFDVRLDGGNMLFCCPLESMRAIVTEGGE